MADPINTIVDEFPSPKGAWWIQRFDDSLFCSGALPLTELDIRTGETEVVAEGVGAGRLELIGRRIYTPASLDDLGELDPSLGNRFRTFALWPDTATSGFGPISIVGTHSGKRLYLHDLNRLKIAIVDLDRPDPQTVGSFPFESLMFDMVMSPDDRLIYGALLSDDAVAIIDTSEAPPSIKKVPVANSPAALALSADGKRLFVAQNGKPNPPASGSLSVLDTSTMQGLSVDTGKGSADVVVNAAETRAYVSNTSADTVSVVDVSGTPTVIATITGFSSPGIMCMSADERRLYVAQFDFAQPNLRIAVVAI